MKKYPAFIKVMGHQFVTLTAQTVAFINSPVWVIIPIAQYLGPREANSSAVMLLKCNESGAILPFALEFDPNQHPAHTEYALYDGYFLSL